MFVDFRLDTLVDGSIPRREHAERPFAGIEGFESTTAAREHPADADLAVVDAGQWGGGSCLFTPNAQDASLSAHRSSERCAVASGAPRIDGSSIGDTLRAATA